MTENEIYKKKIKREITLGLLPKFFLAKDDKGSLERTPEGRLTWRQISTYHFLTKDLKDVEATISTQPQD